MDSHVFFHLVPTHETLQWWWLTLVLRLSTLPIGSILVVVLYLGAWLNSRARKSEVSAFSG